MSQFAYTYTGDGEFIDGVPARDLTSDDVEQLGEYLARSVADSPLYKASPAELKRLAEQAKAFEAEQAPEPEKDTTKKRPSLPRPSETKDA